MSFMISVVGRIDAHFAAVLARPGVAPLLLTALVLGAHGYEIFGFHLTIDEEMHADRPSVAMNWLAQGRWGMALLSGLLPNSVVPVVSTALGIGVLATVIWLMLTRHLALAPWSALLAAGVAVTLPTLPFSLSFTTLAYGLGVASLAIYGFARLLDGRAGAAHVATACALSAFAIAVYQPMLVTLAAIVFFDGLRRFGERGWLHFLTLAGVALGAVGLYLGVDQVVRWLAGVELTYVDGFVDFPGFAANPMQRLHAAFVRLQERAWLSEALFGLHSPWLAVFLCACFLAACRPIYGQDGRARYFRPLVVGGLLLLPVFADALPRSGAPLRSAVYLPLVLALLIGLAGQGLKGWGRLSLAALATLVMLGNSVLCNRLYAAAALAWQRDYALAQRIVMAVEGQEPQRPTDRPLRLELSGAKQWPDSSLVPKRETLGVSLFEWDGGHRARVASLLTVSGLPAVGLANKDRRPYVRMAMEMPSWPLEGSIMRVGDVLILKLGEYTPLQRRKLCASGDQAFC